MITYQKILRVQSLGPTPGTVWTPIKFPMENVTNDSITTAIGQREYPAGHGFKGLDSPQQHVGNPFTAKVKDYKRRKSSTTKSQ